MERETVKVVKKFRDYVKHIVTDPEFPIKSVSQLVTLCTMGWLKDYDSASSQQKKYMIEEMRKLHNQAEKKEFLHNSREITENDQ